jgi:DNA-binding transcriptional regulator YhcF (GntR family)
MPIIRETILDHLDFAVRRDAKKGGDGSRTTREVADHAGVEISTARIALNGLAEDDAILAFEGGIWRLK